MADPNAPYGFRPFVRMGGGPFSQVEYGKSASDPHSIMAFDLVGLYPGEDVPWPPDDPLRHLPRIRTGSQLVPGTSLWLGCSMGYAAGGVASVHAVVDQFDVIFHAQCSGNVAITNAQHAGMTANVLNTPGSDIQKLSVHQIDSSTLGSLPGADIKIRMLSTQRPNMEGPNAIVEVMINKHEGARDVGVATTTTVGVVKPDNTTITVAPDGTLHATGGTAASQTPWTSNIDGGAHSLSNVQDITTLGNILAGNNLYYTGNIAPESLTGSIITNGFFAAASPDSYFSLQGRTIIDWDQVNNVARFSGGTLLLNNGLGIGVGRVPAYPVDVMGDVNVSGVFRVNGVPLTGQTPWKNNIDGGGHSLSNVSAITASSLNVQTITASGAVTTGNLTSSGVIQANLIGLGKAPAYPVDVLGDVNVSGVFRVNGTPIVTTGQPQTPWAQTVDAATHNLNNVPFVGGNGSLWLDAGPGGTGALTLQAGNSNISFRTNNVQRGFFSALGTLGINAPTSGFAIDAAGIIHSSTGGIQFPDNTVQVTAAGAPIAQTPWQSNIDAANHNLTNIQVIDSGAAGTLSLLTTGKTRMLITSTGAFFLSGDTTVNIQCSQPIGWSTSAGNIILSAAFGIQLKGGGGNIDLMTNNSNRLQIGSTGIATLFGRDTDNISLLYLGSDATAGVQRNASLLGIYAVAGGRVGIGTSTGAVLTETLSVTGTAVGIGTATPGASLDIARVAGVSALKAHSVELQSIAVNNSYLSENAYYNGSAFAYRAAGFAATLRMFNGGFDFFTAPSGPASGAFNFPAPALTILNNGWVGIGTGSPVTALTIEGTAPVLQIRSGGYLMMRPTDNSYDMRLQSTGQQLNVVAGGALSNPIASFLSNGYVGIRTALPRSPLSITASTNPNTYATANQLTICEVSNNANYVMSVGYFADAADSKWKGVIQSMDSGGGSAILLNPAGGNVGIGPVAVPAYTLTVAQSAPNPASAATATQIVIKDANNTGGYSMAVGYYVQSGATWTGCIQATAISAGASLVLNPLGGNVGVGTATPVAKLHVGGTIPALPVNTSNLAGSLLLDDSSTAVGAGGMVAFSAAGTVWRFAAIKGYVTNATSNTQGDIVFYVRPNQNDATLTEGLRLSQSAILYLLNGLSIQNLPTGSPGAGSKQFWYDTATGIVHYAA